MSFASSSLNQPAYLKRFLARFGPTIEPRVRFTMSKFPRWPNPLTVYYEHIQPELKGARKVLDAGCGRGHHTRGLPGQVVGIDQDNPVINYARANRQGQAEYILGSINKIPFDNNYFDIVLAHSLVEHLPQAEKSIRELSRVLRSGGLLIVFTSNVANPVYGLNKIMPEVISNRLKRLINRSGPHFQNRTPTHYQANTVGRATRLCARYGLKRRKLVRSLDFPVTLDNKLYINGWSHLNRFYALHPFNWGLPLFCAFYRKES